MQCWLKKTSGNKLYTHVSFGLHQCVAGYMSMVWACALEGPDPAGQMRFCDSWGDTLPIGHLRFLLSSSVPTSLASHSSKLRPDGQCAGWVLTRSVHNTKPLHTGTVNQTALARNLQMCLDKRMRVSASPIAIYCGGWGCRIRHFLLIPVVFAVTSGPSFTEAERGADFPRVRQIEGTDSHVLEEIGFFSPFGVSEKTRQLALDWTFHVRCPACHYFYGAF